MPLSIYKPEVFQGNLKKKKYFEGWYFKHVSQDLKQVYSFIPGVSLSSGSHAFIQVIDGISGQTSYVTYPLDAFSWDKEKMYVQIGNSIFSDQGSILNIEDKNLSIHGELTYSRQVPYPRKIFSPGIMGWYSFIPFMECKHGIVSVNHDVDGILDINGKTVDFNLGKGYIEKDWGTSFPEAWIWAQANNFANYSSCFSFSVAKIPWLGKFFIGFISFLYLDGKFYRYTSYNNARIQELYREDHGIRISLKNSDSVLKVRIASNTFGELKAPESGDMTRRIKESIDSEIGLDLFDSRGRHIYSDTSHRAGLEIIEKIFEYLPEKY